MQMQEVPEGFVVPAGGSFSLEPGGAHIMLIDIDPADIVGTIDVTMIFDDGTEVTVGAPVKTLDMADGDMGGDRPAPRWPAERAAGLSGSGPERPVRSVGVGSGKTGSG